MEENRKKLPNQPPSGRPPLRPPVYRPKPSTEISPRLRERMRVIDYLQMIEVEGMRKHLCFSCVFVTLYDKNNKPYKISRADTMERVKAIVEEIKKINIGGNN